MVFNMRDREWRVEDHDQQRIHDERDELNLMEQIFQKQRYKERKLVHLSLFHAH